MNARNRSWFAGIAVSTLTIGLAACVAGADTEVSAVEGEEAEDVSEASQELVACNGPDCIIYDIATQDACTEVTEGPTWDNRWRTGLSLEADQTIKGGNIVAFKLQWFNGTWSGWYVVGVNDIDIKFNTNNMTMRRMWSYFIDHNHRYLICKKQP